MWTYVAYLAAGLAAGFTSALLGIGGGVVMVPILVLLFGLEARTATATSLAYIVPIATAGVLLALWHGDAPRWRLVLLAAPTGFAGAFLGRWAASHVSGAHVKLLFAVLMIAVGVRLGLNGWRSLREPPARQPAAATAEAPSPDGA
jgi:uncharacterized membrane protein YfcA